MSTAERLTGAEAIAAERQRQIDEEGYTREHDRSHLVGSLAWAAACYAAPRPIFTVTAPASHAVDSPGYVEWNDPWPRGWRRRNAPANSPEQRISDLVKAGALIAAEIDRLRGLS